MDTALTTQVAGDHYKCLAIQPVEYAHANNLGYFEGTVVKYISRWRNKNGIEDLKKAAHFLGILIELETKRVEKEHPKTLTIGEAMKRYPEYFITPMPVPTLRPMLEPLVTLRNSADEVALGSWARFLKKYGHVFTLK